MSEEFTIRQLTLRDVPAALSLSTEAGWNQVESDWRMLLHLAPEDCLGVEVEGKLVSTATLLSYGRSLAWIGMVLTTMSHRGRGYAKRLLSEILERVDQRGIPTVKLDATDVGKPLYEKLGFRTEQAVARWRSDKPVAPPIIEGTRDFQLTDSTLDLTAFGADRTALLERLCQHEALSIGRAYLISRPGRLCTYLGPCVAESAAVARTLIATALTKHPGSWYWDILSANAEAERLAREFGFSPVRPLIRMVRGEDLRADERQVYALAGFELG